MPWDREARYELPVAVWREMIRAYFPSQGWLRLDEDVLNGSPTTGPATA